mmetsp:Transcript_15296/g.30671  ORF Transcript_15296/g.30671 Transcript_15296/m.30671 type:complete len:297 (-) Transcript_15296:292-1182(-)
MRLWPTSSKNSVASPPALSSSVSFEPGWCVRKPATSYTEPWRPTRQRFGSSRLLDGGGLVVEAAWTSPTNGGEGAALGLAMPPAAAAVFPLPLPGIVPPFSSPRNSHFSWFAPARHQSSHDDSKSKKSCRHVKSFTPSSHAPSLPLPAAAAAAFSGMLPSSPPCPFGFQWTWCLAAASKSSARFHNSPKRSRHRCCHTHVRLELEPRVLWRRTFGIGPSQMEEKVCDTQATSRTLTWSRKENTASVESRGRESTVSDTSKSAARSAPHLRTFGSERAARHRPDATIVVARAAFIDA